MVDFRDIYLASTQDDPLYNTSATSVILDRAATSTHVGEGVEVELIVSRRRWAKVCQHVEHGQIRSQRRGLGLSSAFR